jgi:2',3'-cyclic-nucleotide 2'-phosphodiesterase (5'-nucleotidase family)
VSRWRGVFASRVKSPACATLTWLAFSAAAVTAACESKPAATPVDAARSAAPPSSVAPPPKPASLGTETPAHPPFTLSVLALNDLHGRLRALPTYAGYVERVRAIRAADDGELLLLDAGDMFQGTLESNLNEGSAVIAAYNALGVSAAALGNHEFDFGPAGTTDEGSGDMQGALKQRLSEAKFPILSVNLVERTTGKIPTWPGLLPSVVLERQGVRIGIIGALTTQTPQIVMSAYFQGLDVTPLAPAIQLESERLRKAGVRAVIVVAHAGAECKAWDNPDDSSSCDDGEILQLARALPPGSIDLIVAGHTHAVVAHRVNGIAIVESRSNARAFSRADLRIAGGKVESVRIFPPETLCADPAAPVCESHAYEGDETAPDPRIQQLIEPGLAQAAEERARPLGVTLARAARREHDEESPLGNLFADLMLRGTPGADVAITNGGGLRAALPAGPLSYGSLFEATPFDNHITTFEVSAAELIGAITKHLLSSDHGIISVAGVTVRTHCGAAAVLVDLIRPTGKRIGPRERLTVVTSDYLATGGDGLFATIGLTPDRISIAPTLVRDVMQRELARLKRLDPEAAPTFDRKRPRLVIPKLRPVACTGATPP